VFIWKLHRSGYSLFILPSIAVALIYLFGEEISWVSIGFYLILIVAFSFYYHRMS